MKHYIFFTAIIFLVSMMCIFFIEKKDVLSLKQIDIATSIREEHGESILTWERIPYPCYYRVDTYIKMTGKISNETVYQRVKSEFTTTPSYHITSAPIPFYYRITAYGIISAHTPNRPPPVSCRFSYGTVWQTPSYTKSNFFPPLPKKMAGLHYPRPNT